MKLDTKNVVISTVSGLAVVAVGYLVWRHEQVLAAAQAAAEQQAQQQTADYTVQALQQQVQQLESSAAYTGYGSSYGSVAPDYSQVSGTTLASVPQDSTLAAILSAFLGSQQTAAASNASPSGASDSNTSTAATPSTTSQVVSNPTPVQQAAPGGPSFTQYVPYSGIPASLLQGSAVTGINQQYASNPVVISSMGAASGISVPADQGSHNYATGVTRQQMQANPILSTGQ